MWTSRHPSACLGALVAVAALASLGACNDGAGYIRGDRLVIDDCDGPGEQRVFEPYDEDIALMGFLEVEGYTTIRLSPGAGLPDEWEQLTIHVSDAAALRAILRADGVIDLPIDGRLIEVGFAPIGLCDTVTVGLQGVRGRLVLTSFGRHLRDRVTGSLSFELVERRTGQTVGHGFEAVFDFVIVGGQPNTLYSPVEH